MPVSSRKKRISLLLAGLAAFVWLAHSSYVHLAAQQKIPEASPRKPLQKGMEMAEGDQLENLAGKKIALSDYRGKVVLINFWAGWCGPCLHEMPGLYEMHKRLSAKGFVVLGVNMDDDPKTGMVALKRAAGDPPFEIFHGMGSTLGDRFAIDGLPFTVLIDKNFHIAYARAGERDWNDSSSRDLVEGLL